MNKSKENGILSLLHKRENICRICFCRLEEGLKCYSMFENSVLQTLQFCVWNQLRFNEDDCLPRLICLQCYISLENTSTFLKIIIKSEDAISKFIEEKEVPKGNNNSCSENEDSDEFVDSVDNCFNTNKNNIKTIKSKMPERKKMVNRDIAKARSKKCCGREFRTKTGYYSNVRSHGVVRKNYKCSDCDKKYVSHFELKVHLRKHSGERPFSCSVCEKSFIDKRTFKKHESIHSGNKTHKCTICEKKFLHLFSLKTHERIHSGDKPYVCENCGKSFNTSTHLKIHYRTHTKEKPYDCNNCGKAFSNKSALNTHMLVHTGEKNHGCTVCSRKCRTSYDLKTHMRCHSNERPYACKYANCDKKYKNSSQLNVHLRTHTGEKPHQCMVCFKDFGESNTLRRHMGIHEKNIPKVT